MNYMSRSTHRLGALIRTVLLLLGLALLWQMRPPWPDLPRSVSEPLTLTDIESLAALLVWLVLTLLALVLLHRAVRMDHKSPPRQHLSALRPATPKRAEAHLYRAAERPVLRVTAPVTSSPIEEPAQIAEVPVLAPKIDGAPAICILGPLQIETTKRGRRKPRAKAQELIAYLALHPAGATRDELLEALWPDEDPRRSEQRLWQASKDARNLLGDAFQRDRDRYRLDRTQIRIDIDQLGRLQEQACRATDAEAELGQLEDALRLFRDEPLAGSDYTWADGEINRLRAALVELLERTGYARLAAGHVTGALEIAERGLAIDRLNENLWRLALEAEAALGLREAATARYDELCRLLDERLGLRPQKETRVLYRSLLGQT